MQRKRLWGFCVAIYGAGMNSNPVVISTLPHLALLLVSQVFHTLHSAHACKTFKFDPCQNAAEEVMGVLRSYIWCWYELKSRGHINIAPSSVVIGQPGVPHTAQCTCMQNVQI